jgi:hypothetical protein
MVGWSDEYRQGPAFRFAVGLLVCVLTLTTIGQAAHFHKDNQVERHACTVCATHAPALVRTVHFSAPPRRAQSAIFVAEVVVRASAEAPAESIRPPPLA